MSNDYDNVSHEMHMECDGCAEDSKFIGTFKECVFEAKEEGWRIFKYEDDTWGHLCPLCVHGEKAESVFV